MKWLLLMSAFVFRWTKSQPVRGSSAFHHMTDITSDLRLSFVRQTSRGSICGVFGPRIKSNGGTKSSLMDRIDDCLEYRKTPEEAGGHRRRLQRSHSWRKPSDARPSVQRFHQDG